MRSYLIRASPFRRGCHVGAMPDMPRSSRLKLSSRWVGLVIVSVRVTDSSAFSDSLISLIDSSSGNGAPVTSRPVSTAMLAVDEALLPSPANVKP